VEEAAAVPLQHHHGIGGGGEHRVGRLHFLARLAQAQQEPP